MGCRTDRSWGVKWTIVALGGLQKSRNWAGPGRGSQDGCRLGTAKAPVLIWGHSPPQGAGTNTQPATHPASHPPSNHAATRGTYLTHKTHQPTSPPAYDHSNTGHRSSLPADTGLRCPRTLGCPTWPAGQLAPGGRWSAGGSRWGAPVPPGQAYSLRPSLTHPDPAPSKH